MGFDKEFESAKATGRELRATHPTAKTAKYNRKTGQVELTLSNGELFTFSPLVAQGLDGASPTDLEEIEISPSGFGIYFPKLDADFSVSGLLDGRFGSAEWMASHNTRTRYR